MLLPKYEVGDVIMYMNPTDRSERISRIQKIKMSPRGTNWHYIVDSWALPEHRIYPTAGRPKSFDVEPEWPDYVAPSPFEHLLAKPNQSITKSLKECECGAKHTSFPDSHLSFCPMKE